MRMSGHFKLAQSWPQSLAVQDIDGTYLRDSEIPARISVGSYTIFKNIRLHVILVSFTILL